MLPNIDNIGVARVSPPPIHENIVDKGRATQILIRYLLEIRKSDSNIYDEVNKVINQVNLNIDEINSLQQELDDTQIGAGLDTDGSYVPSVISNYVNSATSLYDADILLDAVIKLVQDELNVTQSGAGLSATGTYIASLVSNYINGATSLFGADILLDTAIFNNTRELVTTVTSNTTLTAQNQLILCDASSGVINITLPSPASSFSSGRSFKIAIHKIDTSSNEVTILPNSSELIVGESSQSLLLDGEIYNFVTDGTNWYLGA